MLEYKFPNELSFRYSKPIGPLRGVQGKHFPAVEQLSYDNYLVSIKTVAFEYQFTLLDGANCGSEGSGNDWTSLQIS